MVKPGVVDDDEVDRKPVIKPGVHLKLKVQDTSGRTLERTVRRTEKLQGLMDAYYASVPDVTYGSGRFLYDGGRLAGWPAGRRPPSSAWRKTTRSTSSPSCWVAEDGLPPPPLLVVVVNSSTPHVQPDLPFVGWRAGAGIEFFSDLQVDHVHPP
ncbi:hypothetical protein HU200_054761 [Digitaria exilis]|uniref:Ubiquitin-like domain-containing protein n=1 Tax=Digitaria exilis TaxID=1010633 RepID=A0A835E2G1_9POAL|nr:hypothetical protein HU200_054761 [Digitaria exilis]